MVLLESRGEKHISNPLSVLEPFALYSLLPMRLLHSLSGLVTPPTLFHARVYNDCNHCPLWHCRCVRSFWKFLHWRAEGAGTAPPAGTVQYGIVRYRAWIALSWVHFPIPDLAFTRNLNWFEYCMIELYDWSTNSEHSDRLTITSAVDSIHLITQCSSFILHNHHLTSCTNCCLLSHVVQQRVRVRGRMHQ